ncbi:glycoside hydrolase family 13 protein [Enterococcus massiliensis]|uniref:glycoside hydrolase family 13 protein n=1 Tax=Enterococcus massiliensis TaxID=1640685 RepID=UPI00065E2C98|nr:glycoside hydrolase family 13 protein [Enterococcus massiliensis]
MKQIYYDPWLIQHKDPFGAVVEKAFVKFSLTIKEPNVEAAFLVIHKDYHAAHRIQLENFGSPEYQYEFFFNEGKGLYFYHFEIQFQGEDLLYYGKNTAGESCCVKEASAISDYQVTCYVEDKSPKWYREAIFYQIFPDRFFNGNPNQQVNAPKPNSFLYGTTKDAPLYVKDEEGEILRWDFFGGNLQGIIEKLPYLKKMGITGLYLNPIFEARSNHRYDTGDYLKIDSMLGTEEEFVQLINTLRKNNMHLVLDGVFSHVGKNSRYFNFDGAYGEKEGAYQSTASPYFSWFKFDSYPEKYKSWWGITDLPEIDKTNLDFQQFIYGENGVLDKWNRLGVDGWRLDVADELPETFIRGIRKNLEKYEERLLIGEVWEDASNKISYGQRREYALGNHLQGVMNYPMRAAMLNFLKGKSSPQQTAEAVTQLQENYPPDFFYQALNNLGTHDTVRLLTELENDKQKVSLAFALLVFFPGIPCIYYGDEAGLTGGTDPENRKFFPWEEIDTSCYESCYKWLQLRKETPLLSQGGLQVLFCHNLLLILRFDTADYLLLVVNPTEFDQSIHVNELKTTRTLPFSLSQLQAIDHQLIVSKTAQIFSGSF